EPLRILGVEVLRPVDPLAGVPLQPLPLLVEAEELLPAVLVLPTERGREALVDRPLGRSDGTGITIVCRHARDLLLGRSNGGWYPLRARPREGYGSPKAGHLVTTSTWTSRLPVPVAYFDLVCRELGTTPEADRALREGTGVVPGEPGDEITLGQQVRLLEN